MNIKTALLVLSCDSYSDLWPQMIKSFDNYWIDCPYDKYFVTNFKSIPKSTFNQISVGKDKSWSHGLIIALNKIKHEYNYVLLTLEDLPLVKSVDTEKFKQITTEFYKTNGNYLKFIRKPRPTKKYNKYFGIIEPGSLYRPTCVYALWKIETLLSLLKEEENAWQFERFGAIRSDKIDKFFVVYTNFFSVINTVVKGKWVKKELRKSLKLGLITDSERPVLRQVDEFKLKIYTDIFNVFTGLVPWKHQRKLVFRIKGYDRKHNNTDL